jgi:redox-sensitive bicupin YhaK (pirin superfamily)
MITIRRAEERGLTNLDWLLSYHTFSFGNYQDLNHKGFEYLRVINDDIIAPGEGFGMHHHDNMEIVTYVLDGLLEHKDSMGNGSIIKPGEIQRMSAGTGIMHSEYNHSQDTNAHILQIWIFSKKRNTRPSYEQKFFSTEQKKGKLLLVGSESGREGSVIIQQDINMYVGTFDNQIISHIMEKGRKAWVHVARGTISLNDVSLKEGDGAAIDNEVEVHFHQGKDAEVLMFDMASRH